MTLRDTCKDPRQPERGRRAERTDRAKTDVLTSPVVHPSATVPATSPAFATVSSSSDPGTSLWDPFSAAVESPIPDTGPWKITLPSQRSTRYEALGRTSSTWCVTSTQVRPSRRGPPSAWSRMCRAVWLSTAERTSSRRRHWNR